MHVITLALGLWLGAESANIELPARGFKDDEITRREWYRRCHPALAGRRVSDKERQIHVRLLQLWEQMPMRPNPDKQDEMADELVKSLLELLQERLKPEPPPTGKKK